MQATTLLLAYHNIDPRFTDLGRLLAAWTQAARVKGVDRGLISAVSWTSMLVHFLQRTSPPVLPVLPMLPLPATEVGVRVQER